MLIKLIESKCNRSASFRQSPDDNHRSNNYVIMKTDKYEVSIGEMACI